MSGDGRMDREGHVRSSVMTLVPILLLAAVMFNVATFDSYARIQGDRRGFRIGQSDDLADRIRSSGRDVLSKEWHIHLRIGEVLDEGDVLLLPESHPLEQGLLDHLADVEWTITHSSPSVDRGALAPYLDEERTWEINDEAVRVALIGGGAAAERFILGSVRGGGSGLGWLIAPEQVWDELAGDGRTDG